MLGAVTVSSGVFMWRFFQNCATYILMDFIFGYLINSCFYGYALIGYCLNYMKAFREIYCHQIFYDGDWFCIIIVRNSVSCRQEMVLDFCTRTVVNERNNRTLFSSNVKFIILILDCLGCTFPKNPLHNAS